MRTVIENFSAGYYIVDADVVPHGGEHVIASHEFIERIEKRAPLPLFKMDGKHYVAKAEGAVPAQTIAVPDYVNEERAEPVFLAKEGTAEQLVFDVEASS